MKKLIIILILVLLPTAAIADVYVRGHYRSNGTYVQPHYRSDPNSTTLDNWSTKGNVNPYTGQYGTKPAYPSAPSYNPFGSSSSSVYSDLGGYNDLLGN